MNAMRQAALFVCLLIIAGVAFAQPEPKPYGPLPTKGQLNWQQLGMYCIIHFGPDTFTDKEWGYGDEDPAIFNPSQFSALQIVGAAKAGGFKGIIVVAKHHDGFCLWPTKTTGHNISKSPYKNGKGDILKEYREACDQLGMQMGVYCSPWDRNSPLYGKPEYVDLYRRQLTELYSNYGPLFTVWHDGANGGDGYYGGAREIRKIDRSTYYGWEQTWGIARKLQPNATIFGDVGPDVRWVGNESGYAGETSWATYTPHAPDAGKTPGNGYVLDKEGIEGHRDGKFWMPAECDVPLRPGWFYHDFKRDAKNKSVVVRPDSNALAKSPQTLMSLFYKSVGHGACLDLGLAPDKRGLISESDAATLKQFGTILKQTFAHNLAQKATFTASNIRGSNKLKYGPAKLTDADDYSYWATDDAVKTPELLIDLRQNQTFDVIQLKENIKLGQRIEAVGVDAFVDGSWREIAKATSIGGNRIIKLTAPVSTSKVRLRIVQSAASIALSNFGLYKEFDGKIAD